MRVNRLFASLVLLSFALIAGCGGTNSIIPPGVQGSQVSLAMTDAPPAGVTILSAEFSVTSAMLNGAPPTANFDLLQGKAPVKIEIKRLETEKAFLNTANVPIGTYNSITVGLANPEITLKNDGPATIPGCTPDPATKVCHISPRVAANVTFTAAPFPLTISANTPAGLVVDLNLNNIFTNTGTIDFNATNGVVVTRSQQKPEGHFEDMDDVVGTVANKGADQFTLKTVAGDLTIKVDNNTVFSDFEGVPAPCPTPPNPQNFSCVKDGQTVEVDARMMSAGTLLAKKVELEDDVNQEEVEGIIVSIGVGTPPTQFKMAVTEKIQTVTAVNVGDLVTVNLVSANFRIDKQDLTIPGDLSQFTSASDLLVGQNVQVRRLSSSVGANINTDRVRLRTSRFTATIQSISAPNFTVTGLPGLFTGQTPPITTMQVRTSSATNFEGIANLGALAVNDSVSLRGFLLKPTAGGNPVLVAKKVRKR